MCAYALYRSLLNLTASGVSSAPQVMSLAMVCMCRVWCFRHRSPPAAPAVRTAGVLAESAGSAGRCRAGSGTRCRGHAGTGSSLCSRGSRWGRGPVAGAAACSPLPYVCVGPVGVALPGVVSPGLVAVSLPASPVVLCPTPLPGGAAAVVPPLPQGPRLPRSPPPGFGAVVASGFGFGPVVPGPSGPPPRLLDPAVVRSGPVVPPLCPVSSESTWSTWSGGVGPGGECLVVCLLVLFLLISSFFGMCCGILLSVYG